ncbi:hypothetical protein DPMN_158208 [Dreissena polymorpha]|uniref:HTH psq-type domain-containing protein n=1 Tax=Dreissena polymorpha TaxID=45954 RepID=A0A9D4IPK6_DREPO|nr:hypothetical protein DPMN_158208 [Dreissena polymorpha]
MIKGIEILAVMVWAISFHPLLLSWNEAVLICLQVSKVEKKTYRRGALQYNIPYRTLRDRISGRVDSNNFTTETIFTEDEVLRLVEHTEDSARLGYGFSNTAMQQMAVGHVATISNNNIDRVRKRIRTPSAAIFCV